MHEGKMVVTVLDLIEFLTQIHYWRMHLFLRYHLMYKVLCSNSLAVSKVYVTGSIKEVYKFKLCLFTLSSKGMQDQGRI